MSSFNMFAFLTTWLLFMHISCCYARRIFMISAHGGYWGSRYWEEDQRQEWRHTSKVYFYSPWGTPLDVKVGNEIARIFDNHPENALDLIGQDYHLYHIVDKREHEDETETKSATADIDEDIPKKPVYDTEVPPLSFEWGDEFLTNCGIYLIDDSSGEPVWSMYGAIDPDADIKLDAFAEAIEDPEQETIIIWNACSSYLGKKSKKVLLAMEYTDPKTGVLQVKDPKTYRDELYKECIEEYKVVVKEINEFADYILDVGERNLWNRYTDSGEDGKRNTLRQKQVFTNTVKSYRRSAEGIPSGFDVYQCNIYVKTALEKAKYEIEKVFKRFRGALRKAWTEHGEKWDGDKYVLPPHWSATHKQYYNIYRLIDDYNRLVQRRDDKHGIMKHQKYI